MQESSTAAQRCGHFHWLRHELLTCDDPTSAESDLLTHADAGAAVAKIWQAPRSLVIPRSYTRYPRLEQVRQRFAERGCPVFLRRSGGGLVPQGAGIINLSLAYPLRQSLGEAAIPVYLHLCDILRAALRSCGVRAHCQAVSGSFCDGRFNLACGAGAAARKIAGTAQYWQPLPPGDDGPRRHRVLAHAVLLVAVDLPEVHRWCNDFERLLGSGRVYDASKTIDMARMRRDEISPPDLCLRVAQALGRCVSRRAAPFAERRPRP
ncbi:lipoate--protein ligase family protein [Brenneria populi]|uniref:Lipoate--protein ligase family protein n=1 Tax=Brenneria populi TaxID=1505588 RepID=A0ABU6JVQ2_9GAMM|nr:lipoate--protein ligase family protein [Brenneria populi Li et al. 2015]